MSIYIGKTPISSVRTSVAATTSNTPISLSLNSDAVENFIRFQNFRIGQFRDVQGAQFQLYHSNTLLLNYNSNQLLHIPNTIFQQNIAIQSNLTVASNVNVYQVSSCNLVIQMAYETPVRIEDKNAQTIYQIGLDETMYVSSNLGIGIFPTTALEILGDMRVQSNITIEKLLNTSKLITNTIYGKDQVPSRIDFNQANIHFIADNTIINNPSLKGLITYDAIIQLNETTINDLETSNLQIVNNLPNLPALYIKQLNPTNFANTATGNPLHIESYFSSTNTSVPIFIVDTLGRISSGKTSASLPEPDYGYSYHIDSSRYPYLSGFLQLTTCNVSKMIINKQGYISIGSNQTNHPLQIVSSSKPDVQSLIGLYQTTSNQYAYIQCYDSNNVVQFNITESGKVLFQQDSSFNNDYLLEIQKRAYIRTIDASNIQSSSGTIDFMNSRLSNVEHVDINYLYANSGLMSNVFMYNLTVNGLEIDAFDYVSKEPNYEEFRIIPDRFLFYGSNIVMNPNPYFFETEQPGLPNDNFRIYANGGPTKSISVIKTIGNNQLSQVRIANCNNAINSISRTTLNANGEGFAFGVINLSTTPNGQSEAFITNNDNLTTRNRQLSIDPDGIRIGENVHLTKDSKLTIGFTTPGKRTLTVIGETEVKTNAGTTSLFINEFGNVGVGTNNPREGLEIQSSTAYISGNLGIGTTIPEYPVDVLGTVRATRILGALLDDVVGGSFSNVTPWTYTSTSNIYYISGNVGIGTNNPISPFHIHSCNLETQQMIEVQGYYTGSWPPVPKASTRIVTSNLLATETSNVLAPFMPIYPANYLTANITTISSQLYGNGIYTAKSSSTESGYSSYLAFDNTTSTYWASDSATTYRYNSTSGAYEGDTILGSISGEWIQLFTPNTFVLRKYTLSGPARITGAPDSSYDIVSPRNWTLLASNTSSSGWNTLHTATDAYVGTSSYTITYHLDQSTAYNVYAIIVTKANASSDTYGQVAIRDLTFYEGSNQRLVPVTYPTYQLVGNTSNIITITKDDAYYNTGSYSVSMTSNYTQQPYLNLSYAFNISSIPYTVTSTPTSYIQQSSLDGIFNDQNTMTFTTLSNAFINTQDTNPPLSLLFTYPQTTTPILQYSITGPTNTNNAPSKWTVSGSSDGITWTLLNSQSSITWSASETKTYTFATPSTYTNYRYDFYRNNATIYGPLSIQRILTYGTFHTDTSLMRYTAYPAIIPSYQAPPTSNLSQWNISGGLIVGSNYAIQNYNPTNNSILVENAIGIGTFTPTARLHIEGSMRVIGNTSNEGKLYVGTTIGANTGSGIHFGRTMDDTSYDDTVIESYVGSGSYPTELLIFKGSNVDSDRIRLRAGEIRFDASSNDSLDRLTENTIMTVKTNGLVQLSVPLVTSNLSTATLSSSNTGIAVFKQYTYFSAGNYTLPTPPEYGCSYARIQMWGAGGGGAGGNIQGTIAPSAGTILGGAGGGGGGAYGEVVLPYELLFNSTLTTTIGTGGAGGNGGSISTTIITTTNSTNATNGTAGSATTLTLTTNSSSTFSYTWTANGGEGGKVSTTTSAGNLGAGGYPASITIFTSSQKGGDGGLGGTTSAGGGNGSALVENGYAASGGGGGAGQPATNTATALYYSGGNSGAGAKIASYLVGSTAFAYGDKYTSSGTIIVSAQQGYTISQTYAGGTGGGGGYGNTGNIASGYGNGYGVYGLFGGFPGGGGGGGGSAREITTLGSYVYGFTQGGGSGADGGLILTYY